MKKLSVIAALGAAALMSLAAPSFAASVASCQSDITNSGSPGAGEYSNFITSDSAAILAGLHQKGIDATDVSSWGGCVKADVVHKDGRVAQEFFDPNTLQRLSLG